MWIIFFAAATILVFLSGYKVGQVRSQYDILPCPSNSLRAQELSLTLSIKKGLSDLSDIPFCTKNDSKVYDHCTDSFYNTERLFLHLAQGTIPEDIFPNLHHPASPSKRSFVMSQEKEWPKVDPLEKQCSKIYLTRAGSRGNQPNKCIAVVKVAEGMASPFQSSHRKGFTALLTDQYRDDHPRKDTFLEEIGLLPPLLESLPKLLLDFKSKMGNPMHANGTRRAVTVMVANEGVMDLALNFICSAEAAGIDLTTVAMFVGTEEDVDLVENMGAKAIYSPALGSMPKRAANMYLDATFSRMMWFKTTSVFLAIEAGFDVLFQDVDLVWIRDPIPYLRELDADISFMDDGARTPRYTPFFVNSGFFFVKNNKRTKYFQEKMMKSGASEIGRTHSHQSVLIKHLSEAYHLIGLKVILLDKDLFPSGEAYHERKRYLQTIIDRTFTPFVFHMCWTSSRDEKVTYFQQTGLWFLPDEDVCVDGRIMHRLVPESSKHGRVQVPGLDQGKNSIRNRCCVRERYWKHQQ